MVLLPEAKKNLICWIIAASIIPVVSVPVYFFSGFGLSNVLLIIGACYLGYVLLSYIVRQGVFDVFTYQAANLFSSFRPDSRLRYRDLYQYRKDKEEKRAETPMVWIPWTVVGSVLMILSLVFAFFPV